jgi:hypothetical protein
MMSDDDEQAKISKQADDYERSEGECFSKPGTIRDRDRKKNLVCFLTFFLNLNFETVTLFQIADD